MVDTIETQRFSLNGEIEKLDGGFISNLEGRRKIYKNALDIDEAIGIGDIINKLSEAEYVITIDLIPKNVPLEFSDREDISLEEAKERGIVQEADKFNPLPNAPQEDDLEKPIVVTEKNAYSSGKLAAIDWKGYHDALPMSVAEKALICNFNKISMYGLSKKLIDGKAKFHLTSTRVAATILAKFYERNLGVRNSHKERLEMISEGVLKELRELELSTAKGSYIPSKDIVVAIGKIRKLLIN